MNTVITHKIDGHEVIKGFSSLAVDPEATKKVVAAEIESTAEFKAAKVVADKIISNRKLSHEKKQGAKNIQKPVEREYLAAKTPQEKAAILPRLNKARNDAGKIWADSLILDDQAVGIENELKPLVAALTLRQNKLRSEKAVYFDAPAGEYLRTEAEILDLKAKVSSGQGFVSLDGTILPDNRGAVYCGDGEDGKWSVVRISSIGVDIPSDAILYGDLNADQKKEVDLQIEIDIAADMTPMMRDTVKAEKTEVALTHAAVLRSKLEISGEVDDPLVASQEWFDDRKRELEVIYG